MKFTVLGAGAIGSAMACELISRDDVAQVQVCDARARALQELHERVQSPKLRSFQVDVRDPSVLRTIVEGSACVLASVEPSLNPSLAAFCIDIGTHYCDLGGRGEMVSQCLDLADRAAERSVWVVPACGLAPGLVNVLCLLGVEQFDSVDAAHVRVGDVPLEPEPPFNFRLSWSAEKVIDDYTLPVQIIEEGTVRQVEALSGLEPIHFPPPFGRMEAFRTAEGLPTLVRALEGRVQTLDVKTVRWPGHGMQMQFLMGLGFGERRSIDVQTHLTYRDVLARRMRQRLGGTYADAVLMRVLVQGMRDGEPMTLVYELVDRYDGQREMSAIERCASVPATTIATMIGSGRIPGGGARPPELLVPLAEYCEAMRARGLEIASRWYEGYVDVTHPVAVPGEAEGANGDTGDAAA